MKKIQIRAAAFAAKLCGVGLALLGFSACDNDNPRLMYGTPTGAFQINGEITDENGNPVEDADIEVKKVYDSGTAEVIAKGKTDSEGDYSIEHNGFPLPTVRVVCQPTDASELEPDSTETILQYKGGDGDWNVGNAEATVNLRLKKKSGK